MATAQIVVDDYEDDKKEKKDATPSAPSLVQAEEVPVAVVEEPKPKVAVAVAEAIEMSPLAWLDSQMSLSATLKLSLAVGASVGMIALFLTKPTEAIAACASVAGIGFYLHRSDVQINAHGNNVGSVVNGVHIVTNSPFARAAFQHGAKFGNARSSGGTYSDTTLRNEHMSGATLMDCKLYGGSYDNCTLMDCDLYDGAVVRGGTQMDVRRHS